MQIGVPDGVPQLPDADPHVDHDGHVHAGPRAPRAAVCAERLTEVLDTESSVVPPTDPVTELALRATVELRGVSFSYPGADAPGAARLQLPAGPARPRRSSAAPARARPPCCRWCPRLFDATDGARARRRRRRTRARPRRCCTALIGLVPQTAYLFTGTIASNLRYGKRRRHRRRAVGRRCASAQADDFVAGAGRGAGRAGRAGRHQLLRRAAPAAGDRAGRRAPAGDLPVRRLVLGARPGHRRAAARRAAPDHPGRRGGRRRAAGVDHRRRRPDRRARRRRGRRPRHRTTSCWPAARPTPRSSSRSSRPEAVA